MTNKYPIGAVVKLTGLTSHNIRVWEKRHQAVVANRLPSGRRYYTQAQVDRLLLLKNCIALGVPIGKLAHLNDDQLREIAKQATPDKNKSLEPLNNPTLGIFGQASLASQTQNIPGLKLIFHEQSIDFSTVHLHQQALTQKPNFLILEVPSLVTSNVLSITELIKRSTPALVIIIYRFGNKSHLTALRNQGARLMRAPIDDQSLHLILMGFLTSNSRLENNFASATPVHYPSHIFSSMQLAKISDLPTKVDCECPHHLADLLESLKEFERYSGECINKNDEDAALHGKIQITTAGARHQLEMLLQEVLTIEGIRI